MTATFWTVAALFCGVAILILFVPHVAPQKARRTMVAAGGVVASVLVAPLAIALYFFVSDWDPELAERVSRENELLEQLAQHLERNPNDLQGWQLLAASYMQLGRYVEGRAAYERVWALTPQPDDELKLAYAEAQILADRTSRRAAKREGSSKRCSPRIPATIRRRSGTAGSSRSSLGARMRSSALGEAARAEPARGRRSSRSNAARSTRRASVGSARRARRRAGRARDQGSASRSVPRLSLSELGPAAQLFIMARAPEGGPPIAVIRQPPSRIARRVLVERREQS